MRYICCNEMRYNTSVFFFNLRTQRARDLISLYLTSLCFNVSELCLIDVKLRSLLHEISQWDWILLVLPTAPQDPFYAMT